MCSTPTGFGSSACAKRAIASSRDRTRRNCACSRDASRAGRISFIQHPRSQELGLDDLAGGKAFAVGGNSEPSVRLRKCSPGNIPDGKWFPLILLAPDKGEVHESGRRSDLAGKRKRSRGAEAGKAGEVIERGAGQQEPGGERLFDASGENDRRHGTVAAEESQGYRGAWRDGKIA